MASDARKVREAAPDRATVPERLRRPGVEVKSDEAGRLFEVVLPWGKRTLVRWDDDGE